MCEAYAGYEAPAQFAEETRDAARNVPWAMVTSVVVTALCGGLHLAAILFSVQVRRFSATLHCSFACLSQMRELMWSPS